MTLSGWIGFSLLSVVLVFAGVVFAYCSDETWQKVACVIGSVVLVVALLFGMRWYFHSTESGRRAMVDQASNFGGGMERTVTVYTANGDVIAQYSGKIDIEGNDGGYVLFDYDGKRYIYYNCFVESIAVIPTKEVQP